MKTSTPPETSLVVLIIVIAAVCFTSIGYARGRTVERHQNEVTLRVAEQERDEVVARARQAESALRGCRKRHGGP